jgi:hypothetical protein
MRLSVASCREELLYRQDPGAIHLTLSREDADQLLMILLSVIEPGRPDLATSIVTGIVQKQCAEQGLDIKLLTVECNKG